MATLQSGEGRPAEAARRIVPLWRNPLLAAVGPVATVRLITVPQVGLALAATLNRSLRDARSPAELQHA